MRGPVPSQEIWSVAARLSVSENMKPSVEAMTISIHASGALRGPAVLERWPETVRKKIRKAANSSAEEAGSRTCHRHSLTPANQRPNTPMVHNVKVHHARVTA